MRRLLLAALALPFAGGAAWATTLDSYRFFHVSLQTVWWIGIGIFVFVMMPLVVAAVLYWRYAGRKDGEDGDARG